MGFSFLGLSILKLSILYFPKIYLRRQYSLGALFSGPVFFLPGSNFSPVGFRAGFSVGPIVLPVSGIYSSGLIYSHFSVKYSLFGSLIMGQFPLLIHYFSVETRPKQGYGLILPSFEQIQGFTRLQAPIASQSLSTQGRRPAGEAG